MGRGEIWDPAVQITPQFCRICVTIKDVKWQIYKPLDDCVDTVSLYEILGKVFPGFFNDDQARSDADMSWPTRICHDCKRMVTEAYSLYLLCATSTGRLRKLLTVGQCSNTCTEETNTEEDYHSETVNAECIEENGAATKTATVHGNVEFDLETHKFESNRNGRDKSPNTIMVDQTNDSQLSIATPTIDLYITSANETNEQFCRRRSARKQVSTGSSFKSPVKNSENRKRIRRKKVSVKQQKSTRSQDQEHAQTRTLQTKVDLYHCQFCEGTTYTSPTELTDHLKTVHPNQILSCDKCSKIFMNEPAFQQHQYCHATGRSHFCLFCDKAFQTKVLLANHTRLHTHGADYLCSLCGKKFNYKNNLQQHVKRHSGDKPWACSLCPSRFTTKGSLTMHQYTHTKVKKFSCATCGSQFNKHSSLVQHQLVHTGERPFGCEVCKMRFITNYRLKLHMRTHTGERPFKCTYCERSFAQSNDMVKHIRTHVGDTPYQCDRCDASYRLLSDLRNHYKEHYQSGETTPGCPSMEENEGIRFTSTDILKLRYQKEMAQCGGDRNVE